MHGDEVPKTYVRRLRRARRLWSPDRRIVLSGFAARAGEQSEAHAGYAFLRDLGLPGSAQVDLDIQARDTEENLREAARRTAAGETLVIISNRWHLARCILIARRLGVAAKPCAAERRWQGGVFAWLALGREALALLAHGGRDALHASPNSLLEPPR
nr:YdcF family protein [Lysobacter sp. CAU 1642]